MTYTAQWEINTYTVTFVDYDENVLKTETVLHGGAATAPADPTRTGYTFIGWDVAFNEIQKSITVTALYTQDKYTVTFVDENDVVITTEEYHYGDTVKVPENPTKAADNTYTYTFTGWDKAVAETCTGSATYKATFASEYINYTVKFVNEGKVISEKTYHYGDTVEVPANPTRAADETYTYTFTGWDKAVAETCTGSVIYTATYASTYIDYTVKFINQGVTVSEKTDYHYGDAIVVPETPAKAEDKTYTYIFAGWTPEVATSVTGNATYEATFTPVYKNYTITFVDHEGNEISATDYHYGATINIPAAPVREGYTFAGWNAEIDTVTETATFTAQYTINRYTVTFVLNNGSANIVSVQNYGSEITVPAPELTGYTFAGWDKEVPATVPAENATFTAKWTVNQYTVTFKLNNGSADIVFTQDYGTEIVVPSDFQRENDIFVGWDVEIPETMPAGDVIINALWDRAPVNSDDATIIEEESVPLADGSLLNTDEYIAYINGYEDATVNPEGMITRAEFFAIIFRLLNDDFRQESWGTESRFTDVNEGDWFFNEITICDNIGLLSHYEDETFEPNKEITREEVAYVLAMFVEDAYEGEDALFSDIDDSFAFDAINDIYTLGIISGDGDGKFRPQDTIKRAEVAKMVNILLGRDSEALIGDLNNWSDNAEGKWYYDFIRVASNSFDADTLQIVETEENYWDNKEKDWTAAFEAKKAEEDAMSDEEIEG